ncbi:Uncharacterised protein [Raoultella terrigena]|uniref:Uncharacterized protein n=1 Tax=Raoultella terrigena TaxID=577 RepID=A0A3P8J4E2_RAOTE|nr:Uncharacterised protein [Raoultella terrigena]
MTLVAGRDVTSQAAGIAAEGNVGIQDGRDVNLLAEESVTGSSSHSKKKTVNAIRAVLSPDNILSERQ